ncbi:MAG: HAD family hydrolase [Opitutaceae bacterium]
MSTSSPLLLLWDIDGTLLTSSGAGMRALGAALQSTFAINGSLDDIDFAGRTDPLIIRQIFTKFGLAEEEATLNRYFDNYLAALPGELHRGTARVLPGVRERLAEAEARPHVTQGLLTGNRRQGAQVKLEHHGLWNHFPFGAFADDHELRNELGPHALRRAQAHRGYSFSLSRTWIIGDTPHDIACGRAIGARTLAVGTGHCDPDILRSHRPDGYLADLSDADAFWHLVDPRA